MRRALALAEVEQRARRIAPYLDTVAQAVREAGWTTAERAPAVQYLDGETCAAALILETSTAPAPALVWDERYGWRTAPSRRHSFGKDTAHRPSGDGIRHLLEGDTTPDPAVLLAALLSRPTRALRPPDPAPDPGAAVQAASRDSPLTG
ncbi:DUF6292 family protein [Streptomyces sp. NPDC054861]